MLSSNAFTLLAAGDVDAAVRFLTDELRAQLPVAIGRMAADLQPVDAETLMTALSKCLSLVAGALNQEARVEWLAAAYDELKKLPRDLVLPALRSARRACDHSSKILPHVVEQVTAPMAERRVTMKRLERLAEVARRPAVEAIEDHSEELQAEIDELLAKIRKPRLGEEPIPRGTTAADMEAIRAGRPTVEPLLDEQKRVDTANFFRAMNGQLPLSPEQLREQEAEQRKVRMAKQRGERVGFDPNEDAAIIGGELQRRQA